MQNKAILKQRLQAFEYDPFVRDILNVVMHDLSMENTVYLGESVENINSVVHTEKIFSPVKYIKENECVFNVKGTYYNRKGNTITRLSKSSVNNLDESFKTLCNLINHPAVSIDDMNNVISIYEGNDSIHAPHSLNLLEKLRKCYWMLYDMGVSLHVLECFLPFGVQYGICWNEIPGSPVVNDSVFIDRHPDTFVCYTVGEGIETVIPDTVPSHRGNSCHCRHMVIDITLYLLVHSWRCISLEIAQSFRLFLELLDLGD